MNRTVIALAICYLSGLLVTLGVFAWGHPARALFVLFAVWFFTAEWLSGRLMLASLPLSSIRPPGLQGLALWIETAAGIFLLLGLFQR